MKNSSPHTFHIPVLGLGYTVETPLKVARFGISSVISIVEDGLIERMRKVHTERCGDVFVPIAKGEEDYRARRIKAYLDLVDRIVTAQMEELVRLPFDGANDLVTYFELLPDGAPLKKSFQQMMSMPEGEEKLRLQQDLRSQVQPGAIDVNIMSKINKQNYTADGAVRPKEYNDALAALRGFAQSTLRSSVVFSAGYNPELYGYVEAFLCFFPDESGTREKDVILKVSDYRSAATQGKILAKKGIWVSEFRVESGLNCGGHAFATDGLLLGPILEEFSQNREALKVELLTMCNDALQKKGLPVYTAVPAMRLSVQGGIGTANEHAFLRERYGADSGGWGSPFLLVPEATSVDEETLGQLATAAREDFYLSDASPLGVPFHNFKKSTSQQQRLTRLEKGRPGSPCYKEALVSNTQFTDRPICTASRQYQHLMLIDLEQQSLPAQQHAAALRQITEKDCLCEGLGASALLSNGEMPDHKLSAVTICPGPNLAFFSGVFSLRQMVDHIYGRTNLLNSLRRPNLFVNELELYVQYFKKEVAKLPADPSPKALRYIRSFLAGLQSGIAYYIDLLPSLTSETAAYREAMKADLEAYAGELQEQAATLPS